MERLYETCCGIDVHKRTVVACLITTRTGRRNTETRTFGTTTDDLLDLRDWLDGVGCRHVALESTGVYTSPMMLPKRSLGGNM